MILLAEIGDIVESKKQRSHQEAFQEDKDEYYDQKLKIDVLILRDLKEEARATVKEVSQIKDQVYQKVKTAQKEGRGSIIKKSKD